MRRLLAAALVGGLLWQMAPAGASRTVTVQMVRRSYAPSVVEVARLDSVRWVNEDGVSHNAAAETHGWGVGDVPPGGSAQRRIELDPGTYRYRCTYHGQTGTLLVNEEGWTPPSPSPTASPLPTATPVRTSVPPSPLPSPDCRPGDESWMVAADYYLARDGLWREANGRPGLQRRTLYCAGQPMLADAPVASTRSVPLGT